MAQQDIRYYLNGLLMVVEEGSLKLVATDGHRLAYAALKLGGNLPRQEVIVPRKTVLELTKLLADNDEPVNIELSATQAAFNLDRHWRNARTISTHNPTFLKASAIGANVVHGTAFPANAYF